MLLLSVILFPILSLSSQLIFTGTTSILVYFSSARISTQYSSSIVHAFMGFDGSMD